MWAPAADAALYAGPHPDDAPVHALRLRLTDATWGALARPAVPDVRRLGRLVVGEQRVPLPVGPGGEPAADARAVVEADVLGSAFWWLAGLQETATRERDAHGRFPTGASLQARLGTPEAPYSHAPVDATRVWLGDALRALGVDVHLRTWGGARCARWAVAISHDLDAVRTPRLRAFAAEMLRGQSRRALARALGPDARRASLDALVGLARRHGTRATLFVKTVGRGSPEDVAYRVEGAFQARLRRLADDGFEVGLHPGYASHDHAGRLAAERARLGAALGSALPFEPRLVRSHFLRWSGPTTPRLYARSGFSLDSTLGFADEVGFRRGTAHPFRVWDARANAGVGDASDLWEAPLAAMDTALFTHLGLDAEAAGRRLDAVFDAARRGGGVAVLLWHPAMDGNPAWTRQLDVLDHALGRAARDGAALGPIGSLVDAWRR